VPLVVDQTLQIRPQPACLGRQFAELRTDFFLRGQKFHGTSYTVAAFMRDSQAVEGLHAFGRPNCLDAADVSH
jgi:hypothetical protein